ncbi:class I SAM-dependent methyltransferase [Desulfococcaceae bacterium HSG7]|nr:class I SAM-dependent methyltransferase [Desulfococcaceae bacterium HSG7]
MENTKIIRLVNRNYRIVKTWLLKRPNFFLTKFFFNILSMFDRLLSGRNLTSLEIVSNLLWKQNYFAYWKEHSDNRFEIKTDYPAAFSSDDYKYPRGAIYDNSTNRRFNFKLYAMLELIDNISLLDLGCAGGGLVRSMIEDGHTAVGVDGSDISKKIRSGEWDTIPYHLFTCDITKPFSLLYRNGKKAIFDVITAWDVFEHIAENDLDLLIENILRHIKVGGYLICSIDSWPDGNPITGAVYHKTLKPQKWWENIFKEKGFSTVIEHHFEVRDMVRGNGESLKDWHPEDGGGFHLILQRNETRKKDLKW